MRFVFVHGGMHAGWCWTGVVDALGALGHDAIAPDLPGHGERRSEQQTLGGYQAAVLDLIEPGDVLVGHSLGGAVISLAADERPDDIARVIYVAAPVPIQGRPLAEVIPFLTDIDTFAFDESSFRVISQAGAAQVFYQDCSSDIQQSAFEQLVPQSFEPFQASIDLGGFWTGDTPRSYITCLDDRTGLLAAVEGCVSRLGLRTAYPMWSSHSPFLSRPGDLARLLVQITEADPAVPDGSPAA